MERLADIAITPAGPGDAAALGEVHVASWRQTYPGLLPQTYLTAMNPHLHARRWRHQLTRALSGEVVLVAEEPSGVIGYCAGGLAARGAEADSDEGEVYTLYLIQSAQGLGFGRRLLASMARVLAAHGATSLRLWVLNGNSAARGFYAHLGGRAAEERAVSGWGGGLTETAYRWDDISTLADRA